MRDSWLKKSVGLAALCFAGPLMAAGPLDGIYQLSDWEEWLSVHQNGNHVIVGRFFKMTGGSFGVSMANGQQYTSNTTGRWYLFAGDLVPGSTTLTITGESNLGACQSTYRIHMGAPQLWIEWVSQTTTPEGSAKGIDCQSDYASDTVTGTFVKLNKIY